MGGSLRFVTAVVTAIGLSACHAPTPTPTPPSKLAFNTTLAGEPVAYGLPVSTTDITSDGRIAKIRGTVRNAHTEAVEGIRYLVEIVSSTGDTPRTLASFQEESTARLEPGETTMMRIDIESMYMASAPEFVIIAVPKKLGGRDVPLPPGWKK